MRPSPMAPQVACGDLFTLIKTVLVQEPSTLRVLPGRLPAALRFRGCSGCWGLCHGEPGDFGCLFKGSYVVTRSYSCGFFHIGPVGAWRSSRAMLSGAGAPQATRARATWQGARVADQLPGESAALVFVCTCCFGSVT